MFRNAPPSFLPIERTQEADEITEIKVAFVGSGEIARPRFLVGRDPVEPRDEPYPNHTARQSLALPMRVKSQMR